jgi:hypothetical protein
VWDVDDPGAILLFATLNQNYAAKWSKALNKIVWQIKMPTGFNSIFLALRQGHRQPVRLRPHRPLRTRRQPQPALHPRYPHRKWMNNFETRNIDIPTTDESVENVLGQDQDNGSACRSSTPTTSRRATTNSMTVTGKR